ncbi:hypothetical protein ACHWUR_27835 [Klebsiella pneumoniae]
MLKPHGIHQGKSSVFSAWFNAHFHRLTSFYATGLGFVLKRTGRMMMISRCIMFGIVCRAVHLTIIIFTR